MTDSFRQTILGHTGLNVGRLGLAASYGAPAEAFEEAFEKGCNYFYIGSGLHKSGMKKAIQNLVRQGHRDKLVIAVQTYARFGVMTELLYKQTLKNLGIEYADILILGWHNKMPFGMLEKFARKMKTSGFARFIGISGHNRPLFAKLADKGFYDVYHVRYNPAHRGAESECFPQLAKAGSPGIVSYTATRWGQLLDSKNMPKGETALNASDCYRFVMTNKRVDVCMCGPKNTLEMQGALEALRLGPLEHERMEKVIRIGDFVHENTGGIFA